MNEVDDLDRWIVEAVHDIPNGAADEGVIYQIIARRVPEDEFIPTRDLSGILASLVEQERLTDKTDNDRHVFYIPRE